MLLRVRVQVRARGWPGGQRMAGQAGRTTMLARALNRGIMAIQLPSPRKRPAYQAQDYFLQCLAGVQPRRQTLVKYFCS